MAQGMFWLGNSDNATASDDPALYVPEIVNRTGAIAVADENASETSMVVPRAINGARGVGLKLPLEIIDEVLSAVVDKQDLKACALSCSFFRPKCQSFIFRDLTISCDYGSKAFMEGGMVHAIAYEDRHVHILGLIRRLRIENQYGAWKIPGGPKAVNFMLGKFVKKLKALEALEIHGTGLQWRYKDFTEGLIELLQIPTLQELKLRDLEYFPLPLILWGRALKRVDVEHVLILQTIDVGFENPPVSPSLQEFGMDNKEMGLGLLWFYLLSHDAGRSMFSGLKKLRLEYRNGEGDSPENIEPLLAACEDSLEDLVLLLTHEAYVFVPLYVRSIRLDRLINLRSFSTRLYLTTQDDYLSEDHPFKFLKELFCRGSPSLQNIRLTFFHRFGDQINENTLTTSGWNDLDLVLTSLSSLQRISLVVCCTQCTPEQIEAHEGVYDLALVKAKGICLNTKFTDNITSAIHEE